MKNLENIPNLTNLPFLGAAIVGNMFSFEELVIIDIQSIQDVQKKCSAIFQTNSFVWFDTWNMKSKIVRA